MAEAQDDDPFDWEVDRVIQELCSSDRSWLPSPRAQFPDPDRLAIKIRDADYNGEVLLLSLDDEGDLWSDFGITATKYKQTIRTAIRQFRSQSRKFKEHAEFIREGIVVSSNTNKSTVSPRFIEASTNQSTSDRGKLSGQLQNGTRSLQDQSETDEPPKKKPRRLDNQDMISTERPAHSAILHTIPTEADTVTLREEIYQSTQIGEAAVNGDRNYHGRLQKLFSKPGAFWGEGKWSSDDILELNQEAAEDDQSFSWSQPWPLGSGRRLHVNGLTKRYLRGLSQPETTEDTDTLPLFGESSADYFEPDQEAIEREIEEEKEERRRETERFQKSDLQPDAVDACLMQMRDEYTTNWRETKLPVLQRKAHGMWVKARKRGNRHSQILELSNALLFLQKRLDTVLNGLKENIYSKESELRRMGPVLEPPIYEIEKTKWSIEVLTNTIEPAKVTLPRTAEAVPKKARLEQQEDGFDIWSEEEADGLDGFIVDDSSAFLDQHGPQMDADEVTESRVTDVHSKAAPSSEVEQSFASTSDDVVIHDLTGPVDIVELPITEEPRLISDHYGAQIGLEDIQDIVNKGTEHWEHLHNGPRLVLTMIHNWSTKRKDKIFGAINNSDNSEQVWQESIELAINLPSDPLTSTPKDSKGKSRRETAIRLSALFDIYTGSKLTTTHKFKKLDPETVMRIGRKKSEFDRFWHFLRRISPWFLEKAEESEVEADLSNGNDSILTPSQKKKRRQADARKIQKHDTQQTQAQQARRILLRQKLEDSVISTEKRRLIVNESKMEGHGLVFIHEHIAPRIKDHQIDGVRFMWDQITRGTGCLLAHTMGLGKTMQVITLLTAIADAAKSKDETVSVQIPEHLRSLTTLVLCPPGILNNWIDELLVWAPEGILGTICSIDANTQFHERQGIAEDWAAKGGVLVMGYHMLSGMEGKNDNLLDLILESASLVVGDEAHYLKNSSSKRGRIATLFRTKSRIALTGSPLANKVDEYYSMIDWVAPGFLGKKEDFSSAYAIPIKEGLWKESHAQDRRRARILLVALKKRVANKVHRRTVGVLKDNLPPKKEFILYLDLVEIQKKAYQNYMRGILDATGTNITQTTVWGMAAVLRELLAHPSVLQKKLQERQKKWMSTQSTASNKQNNGDDLKEPADVIGSVLELLGSGRSFETISASYKMLVLDKILEEAMKLGENVLVFSHSLLTLNYVESNLCRNKQRACKRLDGDTPPALRQAIVKSFNSNKSQAFLISTTAGGIGLNIYGANRVVILDFQYNPVEEQQAIGRAYRIGQTKKVIVYWLMCDGTYEKNLHQHQVFKIQLASRVVDEKHPMPKADRQLIEWVKECHDVPHKDISIHRGKDPILDSLLDTEVVRSGISSIDTTETFEEEEEDKALSADDQIEADRLAAAQGLVEKATVIANAAQHLPLPGQHPSEQAWRLPHSSASVSASPVIRPEGSSVSAAANSSTLTWNGQPPNSIALGSLRSMLVPSSPFPSAAQQQAPPGDHRTSPSALPHMVGQANYPSISSPSIRVPGVVNAGFPIQSLPAQPGYLGQITAETNFGQQQSQHSAHPPVDSGELRHRSTDPVASLGLSSTISEQRPNTTPMQDTTQPIMMNAQQRTSIDKPPSTKEPARDALKRKLIEFHPPAVGKIDQLLQELDGLLGALPKQKMLTDLLDIVSHNIACATALVDGRISARALAEEGSTSKDKLKDLVLRMSREPDPDV